MEGSKRSTHCRVRLAAATRGFAEWAATRVEHATNKSVSQPRWIPRRPIRSWRAAFEAANEPSHTERRRAIRSASAGRRQTSIGDELCVERRREGRGFQSTLSVAAESRPQNPGQVSWLGRSESNDRSAGRFTFPGSCCRVVSKRRALTHSGGTAPDLHRTSLLCPSGHPRRCPC